MGKVFINKDPEAIKKNTDKYDHINIVAKSYHQHTHQKIKREKIFTANARQGASFLNIHEILINL